MPRNGWAKRRRDRRRDMGNRRGQALKAPLLYSSDIETIAEDEERLTAEIVEQMAAGNRCAFEHHRHAIRDAHAKSHAVLKGTLTVHDDLAPELRQGIFMRPATYVSVRSSPPC